MSNELVISTAKVRGIVKKSGINYVDASAAYFGKIYQGITVWQFGSHIMIEPFGYNKDEVIAENLAKFIEAIAPFGLTVKQSTNCSYEVVKAVA